MKKIMASIIAIVFAVSMVFGQITVKPTEPKKIDGTKVVKTEVKKEVKKECAKKDCKKKATKKVKKVAKEVKK